MMHHLSIQRHITGVVCTANAMMVQSVSALLCGVSVIIGKSKPREEIV